MKKITLLLGAIFCALLSYAAESELPGKVILTPHVVHDGKTPTADKILLDKLTRIVTKYGVNSSHGLQTPFIITAHAVELNRETTATVPVNTAVDLSVTFYIGNGEEGTVFSTCNESIRGIGKDTDAAYAAAFRKINVNDPDLAAAIVEGCSRIEDYYKQAGPGLLREAEAQMTAGNYADAYAILLRIPQVCPQYAQAQQTLIQYTAKESDSKNGDIIARARAAWSASPDAAGAAKAEAILADLSNPSEKMRSAATALTKEMATRLQKVEDAELALEAKREENAHQQEMESIRSASKVAAAYAKQPVYHIHWW